MIRTGFRDIGIIVDEMRRKTFDPFEFARANAGSAFKARQESMADSLRPLAKPSFPEKQSIRAQQFSDPHALTDFPFGDILGRHFRSFAQIDLASDKPPLALLRIIHPFFQKKISVWANHNQVNRRNRDQPGDARINIRLNPSPSLLSHFSPLRRSIKN